MAIQKLTRVEKMITSTNKLLVQLMNCPAADYSLLTSQDSSLYQDPVASLMDLRTRLLNVRDMQRGFDLGGGEGV